VLEPSRKLAARVTTRSELLAVLEAALNGELAIIRLDREPPGHARYPLDLHAPDLQAPLPLIVQLAGAPSEHGTPVMLMPSTARQHAQLSVMREGLRRAESRIAPVAPSPGISRRAVADTSPAPGAPSPRSSHPVTPAASGAFTAPTDLHEDPLVSQTLADGRYRVLRLLGVGGMGRVYLARQTALAKDIAIKVLDKRFAHDPHFAARFQLEALAASKLDHPNVMRVLDFGQEPDGLLFMAMELLQGESLADILEREGKLLPSRAVGIVAQVCAALGSAHARGVVHRDIKPENIVIERRSDDDGRPVELVKVCDFGLAKTVGEEPSDAAGASTRRQKLTAAGAVMGTPDYMAPEQCRGEPADARSDLYACGVVLFELCTGRVPFQGENHMQVLGMHLLNDPPRPTEFEPTLDPRLEAIILQTLEKDPGRRLQSARELRDALRALASPSATRPAAGVPIARVALTSATPVGARVPTPWTVPAAGAADSATHRLDGLARELDFGDAPDEVRPSMIPVDLEKIPESMRARVTATSPSGPLLSANVDALVTEARALIGPDPERQKRAYHALLRGGLAAYWAVERARSGKQLEPDARHRWRTTITALHRQGAAAIAESLARLDVEHPMGLDVPLTEDLLSCLGGPEDAAAPARVRPFLQHPAHRLRRAALGALVRMAAPKLGAALLQALEDSDPGVRLIATRTYARKGGVGAKEVPRLVRIVDDALAPDELRASAAAALARVDPAAQAEAEVALLNAVQGRTPSFIRALGVGAASEDGPLLLEAAARALLRLGGPGVRPAIEKRARTCRGECRERLERVLNG
jgi:eukaryotic-like serine/threonine-protein kinase